ncbi:MAG: SpoIIE family protein phosphatase [Candidatus Eisenbacteria bacterium]|nr:SpoIIE family protein phosphatase [Candidatus Eisenbacteria bacterium]
MNAAALRASRWLLLLLAIATAIGMGIEAARISEQPFLGMSERGAVVALVAAGGPAERAGLRSGDRILEVDGRAIDPLTDPSPSLRSLSARAIHLRLERDGRRFEAVLLPARPPAAEQAWRVAHFIISILSVTIGAVIYQRKPSRLTVTFFGSCLALGVLLFHPWTPPGVWGSRWNRLIVELCSILLPALLLHFFLLFPYERKLVARRPGYLALIYAPGVLLFFLGSLSDGVLRRIGLPPQSIRPVIELGTMVNVLVLLITAVALYVRTYRLSPLPSVRRKLKVTLWGTLLGLCPLVLVVLIHTLWPNLQVPGDRLATLMVVFLPASFGYAIVRHGVFEIEFIVKRSLVYSALTSLFALGYFLAFFALHPLIEKIPAFEPRVGSLLVVLFVLLVMSPLRSRLQDRIDRWIYPDRYDTQRALRESALRFREARRPDEVGPALLQALSTLLRIERMALFEDPLGNGRFVLSAAMGVPNAGIEPPTLSAAVAQPLFAAGQPLLRGDLEAELPYGFLPRGDLEALRRVATRVLVPLGSGGRRLGIVLLGPRAYGEGYSAPELLLLEGVAAQAALALENAHFLRASEERLSERREMEMARSLQQQLLPRSLPHYPEVEFAARNVPCHEVGGDYYDCCEVGTNGDRSALLAIGDVSGKGVPAALLMANVQASFRAEAQSGRSPEEILATINRRLCEIERPDRFVSLVCAQLDPRHRTLTYANAGHPPPLLLRANGEVERLDQSGLLLGIRAEESYRNARVALRPGDLLLLYTDGVIERGGSETQFDEEDLVAFAAGHHHLSGEDLIALVFERLTQTTAPAHNDDTTLLVLRVL